MANRLYGKPTKFVRHVPDVAQYVIEPQRAMHIPFWYCDADETAKNDGDDTTAIAMRLGTRVTKHVVDMTVTPETVDPQNIYIGIVKLSFHDIFSPYVCGKAHLDDSYQDATPTVQNYTGYLRLYPENDTDSYKPVYVTGQIDMQERDVALDNNFWHFVKKLSRVTVFNQQPLISKRRMTIPSKVKRINPYTYYGMIVFNDAPRGGTPADTQVTIDLKQYIEAWHL